jgi:hypothetical protein
VALTLLEAAKLMRGEELRSAIIEIFASQTDILRAFPFQDIQGNALRYNLENTLPGVAFRGVNEGYTESTGVINPQVETLTIAGGDLDVDKFILDTMGMDQRSMQEAMKLKALAHNWSHKVIKGDSTTSPKEFDGLQKRLTGNQLVSMGSTSGGDPLSLSKLDEAIDRVDNATSLLMSQTMKRRFSVAARSASVGGYITWDVEDMGKRVLRYDGLEILVADGNGDVYDTIDQTEAAASGGATATSIYILSLGDGMLTGIQNGAPVVRDLGELETKPVLRTRVEWYSGIAMFHPRAAARLYGISAAAIIA